MSHSRIKLDKVVGTRTHQVLDEKRLREGRLRYLNVILHRFQLLHTISPGRICKACRVVICMLQAFVD